MAQGKADFCDCTREEKDCVANCCGKCMALEDTEFKRPCPFYMNAKTQKQRLDECRERNVKLGLVTRKIR